MTKRLFIIVVDDATPAEQNAVTAYLKGKYGFWHHFSHMWLVATRGTLSVLEVRDALKALTANKNIFVQEVMKEGDWACFGPAKSLEWLHTTWAQNRAEDAS